MGEKFPVGRLKTSEQVYEVFRQSELREDGVYSKQLYEEGLVGSREDANRLLSALHEAGVVRKGKRTRAQYYEPDTSSLSGFVTDILGEEVELPSDFLERYIRSYVSENESSTLGKMFSQDLVTSLATYRRENEDVPEHVEKFFEALGDKARKYDMRSLDVAEFAVEGEESIADRDDTDDWLKD